MSADELMSAWSEYETWTANFCLHGVAHWDHCEDCCATDFVCAYD